MKCPNCSINHRRKRLGIRCSCGYPFSFTPDSDALTDNQMHNLIKQASANNTRYFTQESLYGLYLKISRQSGVTPAIFLLGVILSIIIGNVFEILFLFFIALVLGIIFIKKLAKSSKPVSYNVFSSMLNTWQKTYLKSNYLIAEPSLNKPPPMNEEEDIFEYGVEKIIIVDKDLTVDMLVKNNEHANAKALIISTNGYPNYLIQPLKKILAEQPEIQLILLHAVNEDKHSMLSQFKIKTGVNFNEEKVIDAAITPTQISNIKPLRYLKSHEQYATVDMLPYAALTGIVALGAADLLHSDVFASVHIINDDFG